MILFVCVLFAVAPITRAYQLDTSYTRWATFNDLPQPEENWEQANRKKQQKYNATLAASIVSFIATYFYVSILFVVEICHHLLASFDIDIHSLFVSYNRRSSRII